MDRKDGRDGRDEKEGWVMKWWKGMKKGGSGERGIH